MTLAERIGDALGRAVGRPLDPIIGARLRAFYAGKFGRCRGCAAPLSGPSPEKVCEMCHAGEVLAAGLGGQGDGEA